MRAKQTGIFLMLAALAGCGGGNDAQTQAAAQTTTAAMTVNATIADLSSVSQTPISNNAASAQDTITAGLAIDLAQAGTSVNRAILGNNTEWANNGDGLVNASGQSQTAVLNGARQLGTPVLRYPGGSLTDSYHWRDGIGALAGRGADRDLANNLQQVVFGTDEFLQLTSALGSVPLFTANVITGDAQEAADWVAYVNGKGAAQKERVQYWEIGNEPYLKDDAHPELAVAPADFAKRANAAIAAMKAVDPHLKIGLPLRSDSIGSIAATPYPGYNKAVLSGISQSIDFVTVHNAYLPFAYTPTAVSDQDLFSSAMAASNVFAADLDATAAQVKATRPESFLPIAVTEYNALFGLTSDALFQKSSSLAGALYVADTLRVLANRNDILCANFWSLTGNGYFGTMDEAGGLRPAYYVMLVYSALLQGKLIPMQLSAPTFSNPQVGAVSAATNNPLVSATATVLNKTLRIAVINKHSTATVSVTLTMSNGSASGSANYWQLGGNDLFAGAQGRPAISWTSGKVSGSGPNLTLALPAHSLTYYEIALN